MLRRWAATAWGGSLPSGRKPTFSPTIARTVPSASATAATVSNCSSPAGLDGASAVAVVVAGTAASA